VYKVILRDASNRLKASNVHVKFEPGCADRVEVNGRVVWQHCRSSWTPSSQAMVAEEGRRGGAGGAAVGAASGWALEARNGGRLPTLTVQAFDAWNNLALAAPNGSGSGGGRRKKRDRVGADGRPASTLTVRVRPLRSPSDPAKGAASTGGKRARVPRPGDGEEVDEEPVELVPMAGDESEGRAAGASLPGKSSK
jgi:hypothetical protein